MVPLRKRRELWICPLFIRLGSIKFSLCVSLVLVWSGLAFSVDAEILRKLLSHIPEESLNLNLQGRISSELLRLETT